MAELPNQGQQHLVSDHPVLLVLAIWRGVLPSRAPNSLIQSPNVKMWPDRQHLPPREREEEASPHSKTCLLPPAAHLLALAEQEDEGEADSQNEVRSLSRPDPPSPLPSSRSSPTLCQYITCRVHEAEAFARKGSRPAEVADSINIAVCHRGPE